MHKPRGKKKLKKKKKKGSLLRNKCCLQDKEKSKVFHSLNDCTGNWDDATEAWQWSHQAVISNYLGHSLQVWIWIICQRSLIRVHMCVGPDFYTIQRFPPSRLLCRRQMKSSILHVLFSHTVTVWSLCLWRESGDTAAVPEGNWVLCLSVLLSTGQRACGVVSRAGMCGPLDSCSRLCVSWGSPARQCSQRSCLHLWSH